MARAIVDAVSCSCEICGSKFKPTKRKSNRFCAMPCYRAWQRGPDFVQGRKAKPKEYSGDCAGCGVSVYGRRPSTCRDGRDSDKVFCNRSCYDNHRIKVREKYVADNTRKCKGCDRMVAPSNLGCGAPEYCRMDCRIEHKKPKPKNCVNCNCSFSAIAWFKGRNKATRVTDAKTCSKHCHLEWIRRNPDRKQKISLAFRGDKHPNWQGGPSKGVDRGYRGVGWAVITEKVRNRDSHTCQDCGMTQEDHGRALEVHHKIPFNQHQGGNAASNRMSNLVTLCKSCHTKADWAWRRDNAIQITMSFD